MQYIITRMKTHTIRHLALGLFTPFSVSGCDMFEYHPYSTKFEGRTNIHAENIEQIERLCKDKEEITFAFITDTQGSNTAMKDAIRLIRERGDIDFIVHGGDQTDFGLPKEFMWCRDLMDSSGLPYVSVIGNHDCLGNGEHTFEYLYGQPNFTFNAGYIHFVCLNTVALEYDYSDPVPDFKFIESDIETVKGLNAEKDSITRTIAVMHSRPGDEQFNNNVDKVFNLYMSQYPSLFCVNGHNHCDDVSDIFDNGIIYYGCTNMKERAYYVFKIRKDGYDFEKIDF